MDWSPERSLHPQHFEFQVLQEAQTVLDKINFFRIRILPKLINLQAEMEVSFPSLFFHGSIVGGISREESTELTPALYRFTPLNSDIDIKIFQVLYGSHTSSPAKALERKLTRPQSALRIEQAVQEPLEDLIIIYPRYELESGLVVSREEPEVGDYILLAFDSASNHWLAAVLFREEDHLTPAVRAFNEAIFRNWRLPRAV